MQELEISSENAKQTGQITKVKENLILKLTLDFSVQIIPFVEHLESEKKYVIARQLLRSATSIGANSKEAQNAESSKHFISKFKIAIREADETEYWLTLCEKADSYPNPPQELLTSLKSIIKVINKIISTTKRKH